MISLSDIRTILEYTELDARSDENGIDHYFVNGKKVDFDKFRQVALAKDNLERELR